MNYGPFIIFGLFFLYLIGMLWFLGKNVAQNKKMFWAIMGLGVLYIAYISTIVGREFLPKSIPTIFNLVFAFAMVFLSISSLKKCEPDKIEKYTKQWLIAAFVCAFIPFLGTVIALIAFFTFVSVIQKHPMRGLRLIMIAMAISVCTSAICWYFLKDSGFIAYLNPASNYGPWTETKYKTAPPIKIVTTCQKIDGTFFRHGPFIAYYPDNKKYIEGMYNRNQKEGVWKLWDTNGTMRREGQYQNDQKIGRWNYYNNKGRLRYLADFPQNRFDTISYEVIENGENVLINDAGRFAFTRSDELDSAYVLDVDEFKETWTENHKDDKTGIIEIENYNQENGRRDLHGDYKVFYPDKKLYVQGQYDRSLKTGVWKLWDQNGKLRREGSFLSGQRAGEWKYYDGKEQLRLSGTFENDQPAGTWYKFSLDGTKKQVADIEKFIYTYNELNSVFIYSMPPIEEFD